jgi:hypothetical protein
MKLKNAMKSEGRQYGVKMYDLIYTENYDAYREIQNIIKKEDPKAEIKDGSDSVHTNRFSVEFEMDRDDWFLSILKKGFAICSLNFQLAMRKNPDRIKSLVEQSKG